MTQFPPPGAAGAAPAAVPAARSLPAQGVPAATRPSGPAAALAAFFDPATGQVDLAGLIAAYEALLRHLDGAVVVPGPDADEPTRVRFRRAIGVPDRPDDYAVEVRHPRLAVDADVNRRLHEAAFTPAQVQLVYDLAVERVMPVVEAMGASHRAESDLAQLVEHFGGEERWSEISRQLSAWGKAHLPPDVYVALASTREGVLVLHRMMSEGEPGLVRRDAADGAAGGSADETQLKALMRDPRYWKHRDPAVVRRVAEGFRRLYPAAGG